MPFENRNFECVSSSFVSITSQSKEEFEVDGRDGADDYYVYWY
jgi:hypothetical protein